MARLDEQALFAENRDSGEGSVCALCSRAEQLVEHELIPRSRRSKPRTQRMFSRLEMREARIWLCEPCQGQVRRQISAQEMAEQFNTLEALREHPDVAKFVAWISRKPSGFRP